ncbi:MAG: hypothetical protein ACTSXD_11975 [Candidatus Heimdallarchaeaceae archaeon]
MGNLTNKEIGSVVLGMIESVPSTISGAVLWNMVDNEIYFAESLTGDSIGTSVSKKYQPAIISLTAAAVLRMMEMQGADVSSLKLGDFSIGKGTSSSTSITSTKLKEDGLRKLESLGFNMNFYKALG